MNSLKDELRYLFSGQGMPYEKVAVMVAVVITVFMTVLLGNNFARMRILPSSISTIPSTATKSSTSSMPRST